MNINDLKQSRFITQRDVESPMIVTIQSSERVNVSREGADPEYQETLTLRETDKLMTLNITNAQIMAALFGSEETNDWVGRKVEIYKDPTVAYRGKVTGGIRVRAPENQPVNVPSSQIDDVEAEMEKVKRTMEIVDQAQFNYETENTDKIADGFVIDKDKFIKEIYGEFGALPTRKESIPLIIQKIKLEKVLVEQTTRDNLPEPKPPF